MHLKHLNKVGRGSKNVKRNVGWQREGNEIIAGQYSVMGWDVVKSKCQVDFPETMIPMEKRSQN